VQIVREVKVRGFHHCKHFDRPRITFYTDGMEVKLSPELQAKRDSIAAQQGRDSASLVHEAVERLVTTSGLFAKWNKA